MPELDVEIAEQMPRPKEGQIYRIEKVEVFTSAVRGYRGLRVTMVDENGNLTVEPLWTREVASTRSKIGAFIAALGKNTDNWVGKKIRIVDWRPGSRKIEVV